MSNKPFHLTAFRPVRWKSSGLAQRSVTASADAHAAPSLPQISFHASLRKAVGELGRSATPNGTFWKKP